MDLKEEVNYSQQRRYIVGWVTCPIQCLNPAAETQTGLIFTIHRILSNNGKARLEEDKHCAAKKTKTKTKNTWLGPQK